MHGFIDPKGLICALYEAQDRLCFHCGEPMLFFREKDTPKGKLATREHIFPRGDLRRDSQNSSVLAHSTCNNHRGSTPPTEEQLIRTQEIYAKLGLTAFGIRKAADPDRSKWSDEERRREKISVAAKNRMQKRQGVFAGGPAETYMPPQEIKQGGYTPPKLAEVFPAWGRPERE